jgi:hypothetical protein
MEFSLELVDPTLIHLPLSGTPSSFDWYGVKHGIKIPLKIVDKKF